MTATAPALPAAVLRVLGDPVRARIVELLADEQLCTCHLVEALGATQSGVSNHLRVLREAGLVRAEPCGRFTYYRLDAEALHHLVGGVQAIAERAAHAARRPC